MLKNLLNNDLNTLKVMSPYIFLGLLIVFVMVIVLKIMNIVFDEKQLTLLKVMNALFDDKEETDREKET